jgi:poly(3-hydroxybutyrate) depolymerase
MLVRYCAALAVIAAMAGGATGQDLSNSLALVFNDGSGPPIPYRLFLPPGHDEPGVSLPLVLFLHGAGERGTNNTSQLAYINGLINTTRTDHPAFLLVPQAPRNDFWGTGAPGVFSPATGQVLDLIAQIESQYAVDTSRRYVTGLSMGGFGTWDLVNELPDMFEAAVPMSSWGDTMEPENYLSTRIWAFQGNRDGVTPPGPARDTIQAIRNAGGDPLYTETTGDHGIWQPIYNDPLGELYDWMFDGVAPPVPTLEYDQASGTVTIDSSRAPGGLLSFVRIVPSTGNALRVPSEVLVNGVATPTSTFFTQASPTQLTYAAAGTAGIAGVLELPSLLPAGLSYQQVHAFVLQQFYRSPASGTAFRYFDVRVVEVPEPRTVVTAIAAIVVVGANARPSKRPSRRCRRTGSNRE